MNQESKASMEDDYAKVCQELLDADENLNLLLARIQKLNDRKTALEKKLTGQCPSLIPDELGKGQSNVASVHSTEDWIKPFPWDDKAHQCLKTVFNATEFRPLQKEAINVTLSQRDCILILPTGGGKSLCFQLAAALSDGFSLVISPLVSLMEDQLFALAELNISSLMLNSSTSKEDVTFALAEMTKASCSLKLLYVTPEKIAKSKRFMAKLEKAYEVGNLSRIVIDEVHCASQWGHDFRPDYKFLGILKRQFPGAPLLGLTATASSSVRQDLVQMLNLTEPVIFQSPCNRPNIFYEVKTDLYTSEEVLNDICSTIKNKFLKKSGIVYCFSRKECESVALHLSKNGIKSMPYHAHLDADRRTAVHRYWMNGKVQVVVATIAFGMGINKASVSFVIHYSISKSLENFYQESGRAGRDGEISRSILYFKYQDAFRQSAMVFTERTGLEKLYTMLRYATEIKQCRRSLIAQSFGETWDPEKCKGMCDNCLKNPEGSPPLKQNITSHALQIKTVLEEAKIKEERLTALKLIDMWKRRFKEEMKREKANGANIDNNTLGLILMNLLVEGFIEEEFHFTPYSTISYIVAARKLQMLDVAMYDKQCDMDTKQQQQQQGDVEDRHGVTDAHQSETRCKKRKRKQKDQQHTATKHRTSHAPHANVVSLIILDD